MPPPDSPASRSVSLNDGPLKSLTNGEHPSVDLEANGKALQDKIAMLMSGKGTPSKHVSRPSSVASMQSSSQGADLQALVDQLQSRLDATEYENQRLRDAAEHENQRLRDTSADKKAEDLQIVVEDLRKEREQASGRITELENQTKLTERSLDERNSKVESLERQVQQYSADLDRQKTDGEVRAKDLQAKVDDGEEMLKNLKGAMEVKEGLENQNDSVLKAKNAEIALLESRMQKTSTDWDQERKQLMAQVDELRQAGQVRLAICYPLVCLFRDRKPLPSMKNVSVLPIQTATHWRTASPRWKRTPGKARTRCLQPAKPPLLLKSTMKPFGIKSSISKRGSRLLRTCLRTPKPPLNGKRLPRGSGSGASRRRRRR